MENQHHGTSDCMAPGQIERYQFYLDHLNKIYCIYSHLNERLSELTGNEQIGELSLIIEGLVICAANQLELLEHIYRLIGQKPDFSQCAGLTQFLEDNFGHIQRLSAPTALRGSFMLSSYLQYSNSILLTSFGLIQFGAEKVFSPQVCHLISGLLLLAKKENAILSLLN